MPKLLHTEHPHEHHHWWFRGRRRILARLLSIHLGEGAHQRSALDVGCGAGANLEPLRQVATQVVGLDLSREKLARAARLTPGYSTLVRASATAPPLAPASFDLAVALDLIEHLDDDGAALSALQTTLRPGGLLVVFVPALKLLWSLQDRVEQHRRRYRRRDLGQRVRAAGFDVERLTYFNSLLFAPIFLARLGLRLWTPDLKSENDIGGAASNYLMTKIFSAEAGLIGSVNFPVGVSIACVARRR